MTKKNKISLIFGFVFLIFNFKLLIFDSFIIGAQTPNLTDLGISVSVNDTNVQDGDVICSGTGGYFLCKTEYDSSIYGIVDASASAAVQIGNLTNSQILVSRGEAIVRVNSSNGNIKSGDFLTTSTTPGVAELGTKQGFVIGTALQDYSSTDKNAVGQIRVSVNIHPRTNVIASTRQNLIELLRNGLSGLGVDPVSALRYVLASLVVLASIVVGFIYFGRIAITGVEAIGRNPLAGLRIELSVIINIIIMLAITGSGLFVAYLILAL